MTKKKKAKKVHPQTRKEASNRSTTPAIKTLLALTRKVATSAAVNWASANYIGILAGCVFVVSISMSVCSPSNHQIKNAYSSPASHEDSYFGDEWAKVTQNLVDYINNPDGVEATVHSADPLVVSFDGLVDDTWVDDVLEWDSERTEEIMEDAKDEAMPWCMVWGPINFIEELEKHGVEFGPDEPFKMSHSLCFRNPETIAKIKEVLDTPSQQVSRDFHDSEMDRLEQQLNSRLDLPWEYADVSSILTQNSTMPYSRLDCSPERMNDRIFTLMVFLNDHPHGGETKFDVLGVTVKPKKGRVLLYRNLHDDGTSPRVCDHRTANLILPLAPGASRKTFRVWFYMRPPQTDAPMNKVMCDSSGGCCVYLLKYPTSYFLQLGVSHLYTQGFRKLISPDLLLPGADMSSDPYVDHHSNGVEYHAQQDYKRSWLSFNSSASFSRGAHDLSNLARSILTYIVTTDLPVTQQQHLVRTSFDIFDKALSRTGYDMTNKNPEALFESWRVQLLQAGKQFAAHFKDNSFLDRAIEIMQRSNNAQNTNPTRW